MSFELRLTFWGLTALLPWKKAGEPDKPNQEYLVVMPSLEKGETLEKGKTLEEKRHFAIRPHQAVLVTKARAVQPSSTKKARLRIWSSKQDGKQDEQDLSFQLNQKDLPEDESELLFQLDREILKIDSGNPGLKLRSSGTTKEVPDVKNPDELHDIRWVPPIDECAKGSVPFNKSYVDPDNLRPDERVAGVVLLDRGRLETTDVHRKLNGDPVPYEFRKRPANGADPDPEPHRQALATGFRLRVTVDKETASLVLKDHKGNPKHLVVGPYTDCPKNEDGEPIVEVKVFNREMDQILGLGVAFDLPAGEEDPGDTDFVIFYRLSSKWDSIGPNDVALPFRKGNGGGGDRRPCEPPTYPGFG
jgi:hypothetical protein